jgi:6,7-dimethyl-8-ribityllumazine synthase
VTGNEYDESAVAQPAVAQRRPDADEPSEESADDAVTAADEGGADTSWPARETAAATPTPSEDTSENGTASIEPEAVAAEPEAPEAEEPADELPVVEEAAEEAADEDPFASWPQPQSGAVVEDEPVEGVSVEHVEGEIDVPDGYTVLEGVPLGRRRSVAVVVSRFNGGLTNRMLARALDALEEAEVAPDAVTVVPVPGAFELPLAAMALAKTRRYACVVALGVIVRGETPHFDYVASEAASGLQLAAIETGVPVAFGVLTVETVEQGEARIDRAGDAVQAALEMADLFARLRASAH